MALTFLKRGAAAQEASENQKQRRDLEQSEYGKMFRYYLDRGAEGQITFVDGNLDENGYFNPPRAWEHQVWKAVNGKNRPYYYLCPQQNQPSAGYICPLCANGNSARFNAYMTIVDHSAHESKKEKGKVIQNTRKLLVAPAAVMDKQLVKLAQHLNGLAGQRFNVSRGENEKSSRIGDLYIPIEKKPIAELQKMYVEPVLDKMGKPTGQMQTLFIVADYEKETTALLPEQLLQLGFGVPQNDPQQHQVHQPAVQINSPMNSTAKPGGNTPPAEETVESMF